MRTFSTLLVLWLMLICNSNNPFPKNYLLFGNMCAYRAFFIRLYIYLCQDWDSFVLWTSFYPQKSPGHCIWPNVFASPSEHPKLSGLPSWQLPNLFTPPLFCPPHQRISEQSLTFRKKIKVLAFLQTNQKIYGQDRTEFNRPFVVCPIIYLVAWTLKVLIQYELV